MKNFQPAVSAATSYFGIPAFYTSLQEILFCPDPPSASWCSQLKLWEWILYFVSHLSPGQNIWQWNVKCLVWNILLTYSSFSFGRRVPSSLILSLMLYLLLLSTRIRVFCWEIFQEIIFLYSLKLWLSFFCLSFCRALRSSSVRGSSFIGMFEILEEDLEVSWLKKSRRELALTSPDIMLMSPSITLMSGSVPSSRVASVWSNLSRNSSQETDWNKKENFTIDNTGDTNCSQQGLGQIYASDTLTLSLSDIDVWRNFSLTVRHTTLFIQIPRNHSLLVWHFLCHF